MKRVVPFFDFFDKIPDNSKYLFSNKLELANQDNEEQKVISLVSNNNFPNFPATTYIHYYEVDEYDFEQLMESEYVKNTHLEKMQEFIKNYKIISK